MKKNIVSIVCAVSLLAGFSANAIASPTSCTIENSSTVCSYDLPGKNPDPIKVAFVNFQIPADESKIICDFTNDNIYMEQIIGVTGDLDTAAVDKNTVGRLIAVKYPDRVKLNGTVTIEVRSKTRIGTHHVTITNCHTSA